MSVTLHWWELPITLVLAGLMAFDAIARKTKDSPYFPDIFTPMVAFAVLVLFVALAIGVVIGRFL